MALCCEAPCKRVAVGQGLCAMHYQRLRRNDGWQPGPRTGRPRKYAEEVRSASGGGPQLSLRLTGTSAEFSVIRPVTA